MLNPDPDRYEWPGEAYKKVKKGADGICHRRLVFD